MMLSKHFLTHEFECRCCRKLKLDMVLVRALEELREKTKMPIIINSGYRCEQHNREVGGSPDSQHLLGKAADVRVPGYRPEDIKKIAETIPEFNNGGIGLYNTFVHLDVRNGKARW